MSYMIIIDELAIKECVESNIYQSPHFEAGNRLARALANDRSVTQISPRLTPHWGKDVLYLLHSRTETGYLLIDSTALSDVPAVSSSDVGLTDRLLVFQRVCRFALKLWNNLNLTVNTEKWISNGDYGVVFPFPRSKGNGFRVTLRRGYDDRRTMTRHGTRHLFAFAGGTAEAHSTSEHERVYKRAFDGLSDARLSVEVQIRQVEDTPEDRGYHPLVLDESQRTTIRYQSYDKWLARLTSEQKHFVLSDSKLPQRVEGPAGTGKTLCLLLRAHFLCRQAEGNGSDCKVLIIAHSEATREAIEIVISALGDKNYLRSKDEFLQAIELFTLQGWCGKLLGPQEVSNAQYLDQDALTAKENRKEFIKQVVSTRLTTNVDAFKYLSAKCTQFFQNENADYIAEMMQHEIGVMIKGRASEDHDSYIKLPRLAYCLPTETDNDRRFVFSLYKEYQALLNEYGMFDTDDIVLTALGNLDTPIWRRRRTTEGYDAVIIDETHLFNLNELCVFHYLVRDPHNPRIIFSIDRSQAPGERGITTRMVKEVLTGSLPNEEETATKVVFRSSPEIVKLAEAITSAGATLFTTFENPLLGVSSVLLATDEADAQTPVYWECNDDAQMCAHAARRVAEMCNELKCPSSDILVIAMHEKLIALMGAALRQVGKKYSEILRRGDLEAVQKGQREGTVFLSHPDYVGGLEFRAVLLVGVDEGRVPSTEGSVKSESRHFLEFKAFNRLYVAVSRARLRVEMFFAKDRGRSKLLEHAIAVESIVVQQSGPSPRK